MIFIQTHKDISPNVWYSYKHTKIFHLMYDIHTNTERYFIMYDNTNTQRYFT